MNISNSDNALALSYRCWVKSAVFSRVNEIVHENWERRRVKKTNSPD